ncbi:cytochrome c biogenesis protein, transmembrane region [Candidatus Omnitrophus magneticus]|uniref:Cytochrome c biogenesis protein, transmembrane region n=1 Tax=Candidatus Omnitrophus magneticus TaxID=1609969 RepID=A0A0F0CQR5_9BACT|nr:cytochrome c biogenesis protein, transmembrane region [Candidatus Omnitrophus magneticus]
MGAASGLIAAPCATAVLGALLAYVSSTQNIFIGFSLLFIFSIGLGTVLILAGTFTGFVKTLSSGKKWSAVIGKVMAFLLLALGCFYIFKAGALSSF